MKILIGCEFSGVVRRAFRDRGHDAWSCDLLPVEDDSPHHIQGDVLSIVGDGWDLGVFHPPCTYLSYVANAHWNNPGRAELREQAMQFFLDCYNAPIPKVCVENPFGLPCQQFRRPDQVINPFDFGEPVRKRTCLWLRGLPILMLGGGLWPVSQQPVPAPEPIYVGTRLATGKPKARYTQDVRVRRRNMRWIESLGSDGNRAHHRSRFFDSIAAAMAEQWG